jgi:hypothetical protein
MANKSTQPTLDGTTFLKWSAIFEAARREHNRPLAKDEKLPAISGLGGDELKNAAMCTLEGETLEQQAAFFDQLMARTLKAAA